MVQIKVSYSISIDLYNYLRQFRNKTIFSYGSNINEIALRRHSQEFIDKVKSFDNDLDAELYILNYWQQTRHHNWYTEIKNNALSQETELAKNIKEIVEKLEFFYKRPLLFNEIYIYLTTCFRRSYRYPDYFTEFPESTEENLKSNTIHELNHFMFYYYFKDKFDKLGYTRKQFEYLKEAFAILTSEDGKDNIARLDLHPLQNYLTTISKNSVEKIIELVIESKLLDNVK